MPGEAIDLYQSPRNCTNPVSIVVGREADLCTFVRRSKNGMLLILLILVPPVAAVSRKGMH